MNTLTIEFFASSSIPQNPDTEAVMDFLTEPESVSRMIAMSKVGLPALAGVVSELENRFTNSNLFPIHHNAPDSNAPNRRNVGWMVRFVMGKYGWTPIKMDSFNDRTRLGRFSKLFGTAAVYEKTIMSPPHEIVISST